MASLTGTGSFHCSANFPVIMFLNIFINEVIRVQHGEAGEEKLEFYKQPSNSFNDLSPFRWEIWNLKLRKGPKNVAEMTNWGNIFLCILWRQGQSEASDRRQKQGTQCLSGSEQTLWVLLATSFRIYLVSFTSQFSQEINKWTKILRSRIHNNLKDIFPIAFSNSIQGVLII